MAAEPTPRATQPPVAPTPRASMPVKEPTPTTSTPRVNPDFASPAHYVNGIGTPSGTKSFP